MLFIVNQLQNFTPSYERIWSLGEVKKKKQSVVTHSSIDSKPLPREFELICLQRLMEDLQLSLAHPIILYSDGKSAINNVNNPTQYKRMKHVQIN